MRFKVRGLGSGWKAYDEDELELLLLDDELLDDHEDDEDDDELDDDDDDDEQLDDEEDDDEDWTYVAQSSPVNPKWHSQPPSPMHRPFPLQVVNTLHPYKHSINTTINTVTCKHSSTRHLHTDVKRATKEALAM